MSSYYHDKLTDLGIKLRQSSGQEKTFCPKCRDSRKNKRDRSLSVNITNGEYRCHNPGCDWKGNVREFDKKKDFKKLEKGFIPLHSKPKERVVNYFKGRGISAKTVDKFMVYEKSEYMPQEQKEMNCICFPYFRETELVNVKFRDGNKNFKLVSQAELILYNLNSIIHNKKAIVTEGEIDVMSVYESGFGNTDLEQELKNLFAEKKQEKFIEFEQENEESKKRKRVEPNDLKNNPVTEHDVELTDRMKYLMKLCGWGMVSVPNGANISSAVKLEYIENCADYLLGLDEIVIATDGDAAGRALKDELIRRFGVERCRVVKYPENLTFLAKQKNDQGLELEVTKICKDLNEVLIHYGPKKVQELIDNAEAIRVDGIHYVDDLYMDMLDKFRNGVKLGDTTRFAALDNNFLWKKGDVNGWTGYMNEGKTTFVIQLMLTKSIYDDWRWGVFCPENYPASDFYDDLVEMYVGKWIDSNSGNGMSEAEYLEALSFINEHFFFVYPEADHQLETIHEKFRYLVLKKGIDGCLIDPWNQLDHTQKGYQREDQYLSEKLTLSKRFALLNGISYNIIAHPKNPQRTSGQPYPVPEAYDMNGGAMWGNKLDNIITYYRPDHYQDKTSPRIEIHVQKIKRKRTGGSPGVIELKMVWSRKRFADLYDNMPCDPKLAERILKNEAAGIIEQPVQQTMFKELPAPTFRPMEIVKPNQTTNEFLGGLDDLEPLPF